MTVSDVSSAAKLAVPEAAVKSAGDVAESSAVAQFTVAASVVVPVRHRRAAFTVPEMLVTVTSSMANAEPATQWTWRSPTAARSWRR